MTPDTKQHLQGLSEMEGTPWPEGRDAYQEALVAYAAALVGPDRESCQSELSDRIGSAFAGLLICRDAAEREARRDAMNELIADTEGLSEALALASTRLSNQRPNIMSFLRAKLIWRGNDILESETRRHRRRVDAVADPFASATAGLSWHSAKQVQSRVLVGQVLRTFGGDEVDAKVLAMLMEGNSIAEIARRTGRSRQQVYRFLKAIRQWIEEAA